MGNKKSNVSFFIKDEMAFPVSSTEASNYFGYGIKASDAWGSLEAFVAHKESESTKGGFTELRYTTPKIPKTNLTFESRTRVILNKSEEATSISPSLTERVALKYSDSVGNFEFTQRIGTTFNQSLKTGSINAISPVSLTTLGCNVGRNTHVYADIEFSKKYDLKTQTWSQINPGVYLGVKYSF